MPRTAQRPTSSARDLRTLRRRRSVRLMDSGFFGAVVLDESARRPVRLRCVAPARAVERSDVLQGDEDVPVELDVRDVLDEAVCGENAVLVVASEQRDFHLLPL